MPRTHQTARKRTGGAIPPRVVVYVPMEPRDGEVRDWNSEDDVDEQDALSAPQAPASLPTPTPEPEEEEPMEEVEEVMEHEVINISDDEEMDAANDDGDSDDDGMPSPPMGWMKTYHNIHTSDNVWHHRLVELLRQHYSDWRGTMMYVCVEYTHPSEETYWKTEVLINSKSECYDGSTEEMVFRHYGHFATMNDSLGEAAFEAWLGLRGHRVGNMQHDDSRYLPHGVYEGGRSWRMLNPQDLEPVARKTVKFCYDMMERSDYLQERVYQQAKIIRKLQKDVDDRREAMGEPRIYEKYKRPPRP